MRLTQERQSAKALARIPSFAVTNSQNTHHCGKNALSAIAHLFGPVRTRRIPYMYSCPDASTCVHCRTNVFPPLDSRSDRAAEVARHVLSIRFSIHTYISKAPAHWRQSICRQRRRETPCKCSCEPRRPSASPCLGDPPTPCML